MQKMESMDKTTEQFRHLLRMKEIGTKIEILSITTVIMQDFQLKSQQNPHHEILVVVKENFQTNRQKLTVKKLCK